MHQNTGSSQSRIRKDIQETSCWTVPLSASAPQSAHPHWLDTVLRPPATDSQSTCPSPQSLDICTSCCICRDTHSVKELWFVIHSHASCFYHPFTHQDQLKCTGKAGGTERTVPLHQCRGRADSSPPHSWELPKDQVIEKAAFSATWVWKYSSYTHAREYFAFAVCFQTTSYRKSI